MRRSSEDERKALEGLFLPRYAVSPSVVILMLTVTVIVFTTIVGTSLAATIGDIRGFLPLTGRIDLSQPDDELGPTKAGLVR
jgi:hypothetical protein